jgi:MazG family protein
MGAGPHHRLAGRQPHDADVQEAAQLQAAYGKKDTSYHRVASFGNPQAHRLHCWHDPRARPGNRSGCAFCRSSEHHVPSARGLPLGSRAECYEVFDAIERRHWPDLCEELGDLLLQVLFYAQMASEPGYFTMADVIAGLNRKLVRRHPHVFGDDASAAAGNAVTSPLKTEDIDAGQVLRNWDAIKRAEKQGTSALDSIPRALPALMEAAKLGARAQKSGFDWPDLEGIFAKLEEETDELRQAIDQHPASSPAPEAIVSEVGDLLFTLVNLARRLHVEPEFALRHTNAKFRRRFAAMEAASSQPLESMSAAELESLWSRAKLAESPSPSR